MFYALSWLVGFGLLALWLLSGLAPAVDSVLLVLLGVGLHLLIAAWRRRDGGAGPRPRQPVAS